MRKEEVAGVSAKITPAVLIISEENTVSKQQYNTAYGWPISHLRAQQATQPQLLNEFIDTMPAPFQKAVRKLLTT